jgi:hypothetical protein
VAADEGVAPAVGLVAAADAVWVAEGAGVAAGLVAVGTGVGAAVRRLHAESRASAAPPADTPRTTRRRVRTGDSRIETYSFLGIGDAPTTRRGRCWNRFQCR